LLSFWVVSSVGRAADSCSLTMGAFIGNNKVKMRLYAGTSLEL
jgi:hypothetical protein